MDLQTNNSLSYIVEPSKADEVFENQSIVFETFAKVLDILLLDGTGIIQLRIERSFDSGSNSLLKSLSLLSDPDLITVDGYLSVGYRIPFRQKDISGEVKIEPFFSDSNKFFINAVVQSVSSISLSDAVGVVQKMITLVREVESKAGTIFK